MSTKTLIPINQPGADNFTAPGFLRRLAAIVYDSLLLAAILFLATALALPLNAGQAFSSSQIAYPIYLGCVSFGFFGWFWTHGGQTLGMRAWKIKVVTLDGRSLSWRQASIRFMTALISWCCIGLGFAWCLFDKNRHCWHDRWSDTRLVQIVTSR